MQSISGSGNVAATPLKTVPTAGLYVVKLQNTSFTSGGASVVCNGQSVTSTTPGSDPKPVLLRLAAGEVFQYSVVFNNGSPWSFDFELYDLTSLPEIA